MNNTEETLYGTATFDLPAFTRLDTATQPYRDEDCTFIPGGSEVSVTEDEEGLFTIHFAELDYWIPRVTFATMIGMVEPS